MGGLGDPGGFSLSLVTESFAVRALLGSVAAAALAAALVGFDLVRSPGARRATLVAPAAVAALAALGSVGEAFGVLVATGSADGRVLEHLGEYRGLQAGDVDVLLALYVSVAGTLVVRRLLGLRAWRRLTAGAPTAPAGSPPDEMLTRLSEQMEVDRPALLLCPNCPGGAFAAGLRDRTIVVDPALLTALDPEEAEGLLAHELAHLARRDGLTEFTIGLLRDVVWFLVPLHIAAGWLRREQEESADELASRCTGRPAALASGILKVWDREGGGNALPATCAAVAVARLPTGVVLPGRAARRAWQIVTARVERLIASAPAPSLVRRRAEGALSGGVMALGAVAALTVPSWIHSDLGTEELAFLYLAGSPVASAESPAFATFRALAPTERTAREPTAASASSGGQHATVETRAELLEGQRRTGGAERLSWRSQERAAWEVRPPGDVRQARPLVYTLNEAGTQMGVFVVGAADG